MLPLTPSINIISAAPEPFPVPKSVFRIDKSPNADINGSHTNLFLHICVLLFPLLLPRQIQIFISLLLVIKNPAYETNPCNPDIVQVFHLLVMVQSFITNFLIHYNLTRIFYHIPHQYTFYREKY